MAVLAGFACSAGAQSVTLYGMVDAGVIIDKLDGAPTRAGVDSGLYAPSRFGMRGVESLGGATSAFFTLENGFSTDSGMAGNGGRLFGREAHVGLRNPGWGAIWLGRTTNLGQKWTPTIVSPFGLSFILSGVYSTFAFDEAPFGSGRVDNSVYYETPAMKGLQFSGGYSFSVNGSEVPGAANNVRSLDLAARYTSGSLSAVANYLHSKQGSGGARDPKSIIVGASYDFGLLRLHGGYNRIQDAVTQPSGSAIGNTGWLTAARNDDNAYSMGVSAPVGKGRVMAGVQWLTSADVRIAAVGYTYSLSKRTMLYSFFAHNKTQNFTVSKDEKRQQLALGVWHSF
ncbi:porin [Pigmentiphaga kullae]|uniref:porin n=1 Tax=Pigmentiphaga kullae TaxID=151784 RepID=UPI0013EEAE96|nr:porin [Pigmentiphaga kullae]